jgi:hypothetical protein
MNTIREDNKRLTLHSYDPQHLFGKVTNRVQGCDQKIILGADE